MMNHCRLVCSLIFIAGNCCVLAEDPLDYNRDVRPILSDNCFRCHGPDETVRHGGGDGGLRLDEESAAKADLGGYAAIVAGKPEASAIVKRMRTADPEELMPPKTSGKTLKPEQIAILERWIREGAKYAKHWSFESPRAVEPPATSGSPHAIDRFVAARLLREKLTANPPADPASLLRRVSFDLIGLAPSLAEIEDFTANPSIENYEKHVDRLLASPRYGERWARRWLDLARYADTNGYEKDRPRTIWPYRDWVIRALNDDMPFDQFTIRQLAGDMLPGATQDDRIATGFHRNTMLNEEGGIDPLEFRYYAVVDRTNTVGSTWLGLTLGCAQCHTHKYDPISHTDYYRTLGLLNNADEPELELRDDDFEGRLAAHAKKIASLEAALPERFTIEEVEWRVPKHEQIESLSGSKHTLDGDRIWRAAAEPNPEKETYTIRLKLPAGTYDRLRLETFVNGAIGPGRTPHGNFVLSELTISEAPAAGATEPTNVKIAKATADFSQKDFSVDHAHDGKLETGWAVDGDGRKNRIAVFHFAEPITKQEDSQWIITLRQEHGTQHVIGDFRVSLGGPRTDTAGSIEGRRKAAIETGFAQWEERARNEAVVWSVVRPIAMSSNLPRLEQQDDDSIIVSGDMSKSDYYDLEFAAFSKPITAIRIEALSDEILPRRGPGRIYYEGPIGDFFLSEITAQAGAENRPFSAAHQDFAAGNLSAAKAIDGDPQSGWSINGEQGQSHFAVFRFAEPIQPQDGSWKLRLLFERYYACGLGRFRISVTDEAKAGKSIGLAPAIHAALVKPAGERSDSEKRLLLNEYLLSAPECAAAAEELKKARKNTPRPGTTLVFQEWSGEAKRPTHRYHRGEFLQPKEAVVPGLPTILNPRKLELSDRLSFARWLVSRENPLTARVTVNRQWQAFFGRGLVRTVEDFGLQGEAPSHPELLDWLAVRFMEEGWSLKKLHRLMVTSATYRRSSNITAELRERDPQNVLLARGPRGRLDAEMLRDASLQAAGLLSEKMYGPGVFPPQPASITTEGAYGAFAWNTSTGEDRYRRSIYTFAKRTTPYALMNLFDAPSGEACLVRREVTNSPLHGLALLNDVVFQDAHRALGREFASQAGDDSTRVSLLFTRCLARPPQGDERDRLTAFIANVRKRIAGGELNAESISGEAGNDRNEIAAWTLLARANLNLDEFVTKR